MRRAVQIVFTTLTLLSAILCALSAACWIRSYSYCDSLMHFKVQRQWSQMWLDRSMITLQSGPIYQADSRRGELRFIYLNNDSSYPRGFSAFHVSYPMAQEGQSDLGIPGWSNSTHVGFGIENMPVAEVMYNLPPGAPIPVLPPAYTVHAVYTPWWFWTSLLAVPPALRIARLWRSRRSRAAGLCPICSYDLRATPEDQSRYPLNYEARIRAD